VVRRALVIVLTLASAACGATHDRPTAPPPTGPPAVAVAPDLAAQFAYDASTPMGLVEKSSVTDGT